MKWSLLFLALFMGCGKGNNFVHTQTPFTVRNSVETHDIVNSGGKIDMVWVIDNSRSMGPIQNSVIDNAALFMNQFIQVRSINWNMALVSTDVYDQPFLGFNPLFTSASPTPTMTFQNAVRRLGIMGDGYERGYAPVLDKLNSNRNFLRPDAYLIVIFVTDAHDQSTQTTRTFLDELYRKKNGFKRLVKVYGAFNALDFGCGVIGDEDMPITYSSSKYKQAIDETNGKFFSTCVPNFGVQLTALAQDVVSAITSPVVLLKNRPIPASIKVIYKGEELPPGYPEDGGKWTYDPDVNGVRFNNLDFVDISVQNLNVTYDIDDGQGAEQE